MSSCGLGRTFGLDAAFEAGSGAQRESPGGIEHEPADHALGPSLGGWGTKLHLACEQGQRPLALLLTGGQRGDSPQLVPLLEAVRVPRTGPGHPPHASGASAGGSRIRFRG